MLLLLWCLHCFLEVKAEETLYRTTGQSVCLGPGDAPPPYNNAKWKHGDKIIVSSNKMNPNFEKTMHYHESNATLCFKNLAEKDNGRYSLTYEQNFTEISKKHNLIAKDAVPTPSLSVTVKLINATAGFCVFSVNCSVQRRLLTTECDGDGCRPPRASFPELNITVSPGNGTLTCTGNNLVSSTAASRETETSCLIPEPAESSSNIHYLWILVPIAIVAIVLFCFRKNKKKCCSQRPVPRVIPSQPQEQHSEQRVSTSSTQAEATYENVESENTEQSPDPEEQEVDTHTVYCVLEPLPPSGREEATPDEPGDLEQSGVHTVYSEIQRPAV